MDASFRGDGQGFELMIKVNWRTLRAAIIAIGLIFAMPQVVAILDYVTKTLLSMPQKHTRECERGAFALCQRYLEHKQYTLFTIILIETMSGSYRTNNRFTPALQDGVLIFWTTSPSSFHELIDCDEYNRSRYIKTNKFGQVLYKYTITINHPEWQKWLSQDSSASFYVKHSSGNYTARKEARDLCSYWYAYRRSKGKSFKLYLGPTKAIDSSLLEEAGRELQHRITIFACKNE